MRKLAVVIGIVEALLLIGYAFSIAVFSRVGSTSGVTGATDLAVPILVGLLLLFGGLVGLVTWGLWSGHGAARTPFMLAQAFTVVAAWTLATGGEAWERGLGVALIAAAVVAVAGAVRAE